MSQWELAINRCHTCVSGIPVLLSHVSDSSEDTPRLDCGNVFPSFLVDTTPPLGVGFQTTESRKGVAKVTRHRGK